MIAYFIDVNNNISTESFEPQSWAFGVPLMSDGLLLRDLEKNSEGYLYRCRLNPKKIQVLNQIPSRGQIEDLKASGCDVLQFHLTADAPYLHEAVSASQYLVFDPDCVAILDCQPLRKSLKESLVLHSELNSKLFDGEGCLRKDVRDRLIEIGDEFVSSLKEDGVPLSVCDYWLVGSNAAYNYQPDSDVDLHIIVNMEDLDVDEKILRILYDYIKSNWSQKYDITIKGHPLEIYLEDSRTSSASNGIYSIKRDRWIKVPEPQEDGRLYPEESELYRDWLSRYNNLEDEDVEQFINDLYLMRKESLAAEGEFALGNLIFKEFRNSGKLDRLKDRKNEIKSRELTLESLNEGYLVEATVPQYREMLLALLKALSSNSKLHALLDSEEPLEFHHYDAQYKVALTKDGRNTGRLKACNNDPRNILLMRKEDHKSIPSRNKATTEEIKEAADKLVAAGRAFNIYDCLPKGVADAIERQVEGDSLEI